MFKEKLKDLRVIDDFNVHFHGIMHNEVQRWAFTKKTCNVFF